MHAHVVAKKGSDTHLDLIGSGIGREVAKALALRGASTLICADLHLEFAKETVDLCRHLQPGPSTAVALKADVRDEEAVQRMVNESVAKSGRIDYFVSTAGVGKT